MESGKSRVSGSGRKTKQTHFTFAYADKLLATFLPGACIFWPSNAQRHFPTRLNNVIATKNHTLLWLYRASTDDNLQELSKRLLEAFTSTCRIVPTVLLHGAKAACCAPVNVGSGQSKPSHDDTVAGRNDLCPNSCFDNSSNSQLPLLLMSTGFPLYLVTKLGIPKLS